MKIMVCIGSACHLNGAYDVVEILKELVANCDIDGEIELTSSFCMGACGKGVSVKIDDGKVFNVLPETTKDFFTKEVLKQQ